MKLLKNRCVPLLGSIAALCVPALGTDFLKLQNTAALNDPTAWVNNAVPTATDVLVWDETFGPALVKTSLSQLGGNLSVAGIRVEDVGGTQNANAQVAGFLNTGSANTLTIGADGIDLSAATQAFILQSRVLLSASQTWHVPNVNTNTSAGGFAAGEDLMMEATGSGATINLGGFTVNKTGAGVSFIASGYTVSNGTFNVNEGTLFFAGGGSRTTTVNSTVTINVASGATLFYQANSGGVTSNAPINLNGGTVTIATGSSTTTATIAGAMTVNSASTVQLGKPLTTDGSTGNVNLNVNLNGSAPLSLLNVQPAGVVNRLRLGGNNSAYSGTITLGGLTGKATHIVGANAGSAAATWQINLGHTLEISHATGITVSLGTLNGLGNLSSATGNNTVSIGAGAFGGVIGNGGGTLALTKTGNGTLLLAGANTYNGVTNVNGGTLVVTPSQIGAGAINVAGGATFGVQVVTPGSGFFTSTITSAANATISANLGTLANPATAPISVTTLTANGPTTLRVQGSNLSPGQFPVLAYTGPIGGGGLANISLALPFRVAGSLVDVAGVSLNAEITGVGKLRWNGVPNGDWDIDTVGNGSVGTPNWSATVGSSTYVEAAVGVDSPIFDDSATGTTNVTLVATLTPNGIEVNNSAVDYTFGGTGKITGSGALTKRGTKTLTLVNAGVNDFTGGLTIEGGTVKLGNGATAGAGTMGAGAVVIQADGTLELNRPDHFTIGGGITGAGTLIKSLANTITMPAVDLSGPVFLNGGTLVFGQSGIISGAISGSGNLTVNGGVFQLAGNTANTQTGQTTISTGTLQLNKSGAPALAGTVLLTGNGVLSKLQPDQIADDATFHYDKALNGGSYVLNETVGAVNLLNGNATGAQFQAQNGCVVVGLLTAHNTSMFAVASGHTASVGGLVMHDTAIIRIAANNPSSTLNVGALGITASGGTIEVAQGTGGADAVLNLGGNLTTTGNLTITDGGYVGGALRQINLGDAERTFHIGAGTTTTIAADIAGTGGILKTGNGTLRLTAASNSNYTGPTTVNAGRFVTTPSQTAGPLVIGGSGSLEVILSAAGTGLVSQSLTTSTGAKLVLDAGGTGNPLSPVVTTGAFSIGGATTIQLTGTALAAGTGIPLIGYTGALGGVGFPGLSISLPPRVAGTLVNNLVDSRIDVNLTAESIKWNGNLTDDWDIDPDGSGATGTANWLTTISGQSTRYFQGTGGTDSVRFDDSAAGNGAVELTATLSPGAVVVDASAKTYVFGGDGKLTGSMSLLKEGSGKLILAGTSGYDYTGGTVVNGGTLEFGDGVTVAAGAVPEGAITNNGTLSFNRPDSVAVTQAITGTGAIVKRSNNVLTLGAAVNNQTSYQIEAGTLRFSGGGTLSGPISGAGTFEVSAGTLQLAGGDPVAVPLTRVSGGLLQLNKFVVALSGNIELTANGAIEVLGFDQIADAATLSFLGTSTDGFVNNNAETIANLICNPSVTTGQILLRNGFIVANTATVNRGTLGIASGHEATFNALTMTGGAVRIGANTLPSTLNIGPGGITASAGTIEVKYTTTDQDAVLNLGGNVTTTGTFNITNASYNGTSQNVINLIGDRIFQIGSGTTTISPDIGGLGSLTKTGAGTLTLAALSNSNYAGITTVSAGTLILNGTIFGSAALSVSGLLGGSGSATLGDGGDMSLELGGRLSPGTGTSQATLTFGFSGGGAMDLVDAVTPNNSLALVFALGAVASSDRVVLQGGPLEIGTGVLEFNDFAFTSTGAFTNNVDYVLFDGNQPITGTLGPNVLGVVGGFQVELQISPDGQDLILHVPEPGSVVLMLGGLAILGCRRRRR